MGLLATVVQPRDWITWQSGALIALVLSLLVVVYLMRTRVRDRRFTATIAAKARRNSSIVEASGEGIFELDAEGIVCYANPSAARLLGYSPEELLGVDYRKLIVSIEPDKHGMDTERRVRYTTDLRRGVGAMLKRKDGRPRPVEYKIVPLLEQGHAVGTLFSFADIAERVRLDMMLQDLQATAKVGAWEYHPESSRLIITDEVYRLFDLGLDTGLEMSRIIGMFNDPDRSRIEILWRDAIATGQGFEVEAPLVTRRGRRLWLHVIAHAERFNNLTLRVYGIFQDVTERCVAEQKLRETRDFFAHTLDAMPLLVMYIKRDGSISYSNRQKSDWWSNVPDNILGQRLNELLDSARYERLLPHIATVLSGKAQRFNESNEIDAKRVDWQLHCIPEMAADGNVRGFFLLAHDLTEHKRLEARLVQAQKLEAVGQLTGGIAHDFNNLLGVIIGSLQLLERSLGDNTDQMRKVSAAMRAATRGADLTRHLLAFARRQILEPEVIDLSRQLKGLSELLHRALGDSIEAHIDSVPELWLTRVDTAHVESAILNLAINARDAMPLGGRLDIHASNRVIDADFCAEHPGMTPGHYVCISVQDTGSGISPETLPNVFEPFFTTKEVGKGSGLGLSMVLGFATQSGGTATIDSKPDLGTTVSIFLPRCFQERTRHDDTGIHRVPLPGGPETILVVEDDPDLRETSAASLRALGYRIIQAQTPEHALQILSNGEQVDLLFTDIMMPGGMLGPKLAERARQLQPNISVLFTTGYANTQALLTSQSVSNSEVIPKPFRTEQLALRIRHLLDGETHVV